MVWDYEYYAYVMPWIMFWIVVILVICALWCLLPECGVYDSYESDSEESREDSGESWSSMEIVEEQWW